MGWSWPIPQERAKQFKAGPNGNQVRRETLAVWREVFSQAIPGGPTAVGFDQYFGTDVPNWPPYCFIENERTVGIPTHYLSQSLIGNNQASMQGPALKDWTLEPILPTLGNRAEKYIQSRSESDSPFFIYMPLTSPHTPLSVNEAWKGKSGLGLYADFVMETDNIVGQVVGALDKAGLADNTLVLFTSDNGCAPYIGVSKLEEQGHYPSGPLRGYKADAWEGGHRVPFIVRWPGKVQPGSVCHQLVHQADLMATLADVTDASIGDRSRRRQLSVFCRCYLVRILRFGPTQSVAQFVAFPACEMVRGNASRRRGQEAGEKAAIKAKQCNFITWRMTWERLVIWQTNILRSWQDMMDLLEKLIVNGRSTPGPKQANDVPVRRYPAKR